MLPTPEHAPAWLAAVARRRSRRSFDGVPANTSELLAIESLCKRFRPYADARVELVTDPAVDLFKGIIGGYGKVTDAPHVLLFIADTRSPFANQHLGYTGEAIVLDATSRSLDTCWIGGFFDPKKAASLVELTAGERVLAASPLGTAVASATATERTMTGMAGSHARKPVEVIAPGGTDGWPSWAIGALETARQAPSAVNRQPWRFRWDGDGMVVSVSSRLEAPKVTKRLDCGIAMLHVEIAALSYGVRGSWEDLSESLDVARFVPATATS
jgi:hypothetical protein